MREKFFEFVQQVAQGLALDYKSSVSLIGWYIGLCASAGHNRTLDDKSSASRTWRCSHASRIGWLVVVVGLACLALPANAQPRDNRVGLVVQFGNEAVVTGCYAYTPGMTGLDLLRRAGLETAIEYQSIGALVCRIGAPTIGADGCDYPREDCLCQARTLPWRYWAYWRLEGDSWVYADRSLSGRTLQPGDVDGWAWGIGTTDFGAKPPRLTFDNICPAPTQTPSPVPTSAPPVLPTATATEPPTRTPTASATVTLSPTPPPSWTPTVPPTDTRVVTSALTPGVIPSPALTPFPTSSPLAEPGQFTPTRIPTASPVIVSPTLPIATPSHTPGPTLRPALTAPLVAGQSVTPTLAPPGVSPTSTPTQPTTTTPTSQASVARVDLTRLTPVVEGGGSTGVSQTPPLSYAFFVVLIAGLLVYLLGRRRGVG